MKKIIVVSAINFFEGGPLTILKECLEYSAEYLSLEYKIIALVHDAKLLRVDNIEFIEYKKSRKSWLHRLYYEYCHFFFLSKRLKPHLWLSLHDISPNVTADIQAVYCHNPSPFYSFSFHALKYNYQVALFSLFYKFLYRINIRKNAYVIVQQNWIRNAFKDMYNIKNVVVSYPNSSKTLEPETKAKNGSNNIFLYPAFPRVFKNFEVVAEAAKILHDNGFNNFKVLITIRGVENKFARYIADKYKDVPTISFIGLKSKEEINTLYQQVSCLIFPSKLETWGLPVTEAKQFNLPIILADLPYAHETVGTYDKVKFFCPDNCEQLAKYMRSFLDGTLAFDGNQAENVQEPFVQSWDELFDVLLSSGVKSNA
ncbi:MAG: glycosyltransferase family 4 protein [Proteobacteria bacterium]|nr:glycosyltransferase family 4 protein [Pseudomonadota bacterium]